MFLLAWRLFSIHIEQMSLVCITSTRCLIKLQSKAPQCQFQFLRKMQPLQLHLCMSMGSICSVTNNSISSAKFLRIHQNQIVSNWNDLRAILSMSCCCNFSKNSIFSLIPGLNRFKTTLTMYFHEFFLLDLVKKLFQFVFASYFEFLKCNSFTRKRFSSGESKI
jgi:hypothetical protein